MKYKCSSCTCEYCQKCVGGSLPLECCGSYKDFMFKCDICNDQYICEACSYIVENGDYEVPTSIELLFCKKCKKFLEKKTIERKNVRKSLKKNTEH